MSNTITFKHIFIFIVLLNVQAGFSQVEKGKVWATVDDLSVLPVRNAKGEFTSPSAALQRTINQFAIKNVQLAFPASKNASLQKVYEFECDCNQALLSEALEIVGQGISKPQEAPAFELMYDPNDYNTSFAVDYALDLINAKQAWDISKGDSSIILGISDANFNINHLELVGKVLYAEPNMSNPNIDHGTAVATISAGNTDNGIGKSSIGFNSRLKVYTMGYNQILQASQNGARVINMSWSSGCSANSYCQSVIDEIYANGTVMVSAAGNGSTCGGPTMIVYPAAYNHVISVTSIGAASNHDRWYAGVNYPHQHNAFVDISAPGYDVGVTNASNGYHVGSGTSYAAPYVTGTIGLMLAANPCLNPDDVEFILKASSADISALNPGYDGLIGAGRLDAAAAVLMAKNFAKLNMGYTQTDYQCASGTGSIELSTTGGTEPYSYTWNTTPLTSGSIADQQLGTYLVSVTDGKGCTGDTVVTVAALGPVVNYDYPSNVVVNSSSFSFADQNGDGIIKIKGNVTIANDISFKIETKKLEFAYGTDDFAGIIVNPGATLSIAKNSSLKGLSNCPVKWDGIIIKDNAENTNGTISYAAAAGKLILDKVNIYDTKCAVKTELDSFTVDSLLYCGTVTISNSVFQNNEIAIQLTSNPLRSDENSVSSTIFLLEDPTVLNPVHIQLSNVENLVLLKNSFFGNDEVAKPERGTAIQAFNSTLFVAQDLTTEMMDIPTEGNQFYNLSRGIHWVNTDQKVRNAQITGSYFTKVNEAISIDQLATGLIYKNEFDVPLGNESTPSFGVKIGNSSSLVVTDNTFTTTNLLPDYVYGVVLSGTDTNKMDVYRNNFEGNFTVANLFEGNNLKTFVDCNKYAGTNDNHWVIRNGKLADQSGQDASGLSLIYKNDFANCQNGNPQIFLDANSSGFVYQSKAVYMPISTTEGVIEAVITANAEDNQCRNFFDTSIPPPAEVEPNYALGTSLFPNPTVNSSAVTWNEVDIDQIMIYTASGALLNNVMVSGTKGIYEISNLSSGMYFVNLSFESTVFKTEKLVVSH